MLCLSVSNVLNSFKQELLGVFFEDDRHRQAFTQPSIMEEDLSVMNNRTRNNRPTFLWGIPTVDNGKERKLRQMVRETYLSFYRNDSENRNRICSLNDLLRGNVTFGECQIAYTFFVGANRKGPTELLVAKDSFSMLANPPKDSTIKEEDDIVYLNIRENMNKGKTPTWFKYASMVAEDEKYPFDYIVKVDSDTLVFTPAFLEFAELHLSDTTKLVHAGLPFFDYFCKFNDPFHDHPCPLPLSGDMYMSGEASIMSTKLARVMTSKQCNRSGLWYIPHEDVLASNWAFHCANTTTNSTVHVVPIRLEQVLRFGGVGASWQPKLPHLFSNTLWAHSTDETGSYYKDPVHYRETWEGFVKYWHHATSNRTVVSKKRIRAKICWLPPACRFGCSYRNALFLTKALSFSLR